MTATITTRWREPKSRITLTLEVFDEPLKVRVGTMQLDATRWARLRIEGKPNARWRALDCEMEDVSVARESWCALDCGHNGTVFLTDRSQSGATRYAAFSKREMTLREGPGWLFQDVTSTPSGTSRIDALALVALLPATLLGEETYCNVFEEECWQPDESASSTWSSTPIPLAPIAAQATAACQTALTRRDLDATVLGIVAARLHTNSYEIDCYTGDTTTNAWLNVLCNVRIGRRETKMVFVFLSQDVFPTYSDAASHAELILQESADAAALGRLWLIGSETPDADALRHPPVGCSLSHTPPDQVINVWQTEWADRLFGDPS
jgi:hypothetical protein